VATTADRVLPWRRTSQAVPSDVRDLVETYRSRHPKADTALLTRAYEVAAEAHEGQVRRSGDPYIVHPLAVATILAELGMSDELDKLETAWVLQVHDLPPAWRAE
jgi:GTP pyrophosphokinase